MWIFSLSLSPLGWSVADKKGKYFKNRLYKAQQTRKVTNYA